jgi:hypothetical protein
LSHSNIGTSFLLISSKNPRSTAQFRRYVHFKIRAGLPLQGTAAVRFQFATVKNSVNLGTTRYLF